MRSDEQSINRMEAIMESRFSLAGNRMPENSSVLHHVGGLGIFQLLVLGLTAFTALMVQIAMLMSLFINIGG